VLETLQLLPFLLLVSLFLLLALLVSLHFL
jgi:hypothetical protein